MTTQAQGKGKKKSKEASKQKLSLDEYNQIDAPLGHSVVNVKVTGLDWAETMADYDQQSAEIQQIIVPAAPRAQRGPNVDLESLPTEAPFRVNLFNLPMSVEEKEIIERFFAGIDVKGVQISKSNTTVELGSRHDMYEALCKDGVSLKGRTINVCIFGQLPPPTNYGQDRYGGRGSNSSYGDRSYQSGGYGGQRSGDRYGDRSGGFNRDRDNYTGYNRGGAGGGAGGGFGSQRGGGYDRYNDSNRNNFRDNNRGQYTSGGGEPASEEPENWRARPTVKPQPATTYNNGSRQPYVHSRPESSQPYHQQSAPSHHQQYQHTDSYYQPRYQQQQHNQPPNNSPHSQFDNQSSSNNRQATPSSNEERPKLILHKRKTPLNVDDVSSVVRNEAIFGKAKPSSTPYLKMNEVEEKLKAVQIVDRKDSKEPSHAGSQVGSQPGSAPRSRRVSSNHSESNS